MDALLSASGGPQVNPRPGRLKPGRAARRRDASRLCSAAEKNP